MDGSWIVLKYGGTSVSRVDCWDTIVERVRTLGATNRVWLTHSALSQVSNRLERAIEEARGGGGHETYEWIAARHREFASEVGADAEGFRPVERLLLDLERLLEGIRLTGETPPRLRARVLSFGELASTRLGRVALALRGIDARWLDARSLLASQPPPVSGNGETWLDAHVSPEHDPAPLEKAAAGSGVVITQGFIARTPAGETCLLGRGGSDTSAALFAAKLGARRVEIWTDVNGMFTADPRQIPSARIIREIGYREAQELAAMGAKVLHPRCLDPVSRAGIPLEIRNTFAPESPGTRVSAVAGDDPAVIAVVCRTGVTLLTLTTLNMWGASGFLARAFAPFQELGVSVDLVATSQSAVSLTLDHIPGGVGGPRFKSLLDRLSRLGTTNVVHPCAVVSVVGRKIRTVLHELGPALAVFREHEVHLVSESSENLNLSFVVDEGDAAPLVRNLHGRLFTPQGHTVAGDRFGDTWESLEPRSSSPAAWWTDRRDDLLARMGDRRARYVYDTGIVRGRARCLREGIPSVRQWFYSVKANPHPRILETMASERFGLECVSEGEVRLAREVAGDEVPVLFTPNFCPVEEYSFALERGAEITVDGPHVLEQAPDLFRGTRVGLRIDPGEGSGHHEKVCTAGGDAKFGHPAGEIDAFLEAADRLGMTVTGLHAHVGSGILDPAAWVRVGERLASLAPRFPGLLWIDLGGGLGVAERPGQSPLDLGAVERGIASLATVLGGVAVRMEPGRYLVSDAGVLLAPVTQVREKGTARFVGVSTGMNSLLRPALYGAWHAIHNLTRMGDPPAGYCHVVGPICESGDVLGRDRLLPVTRPGDVLLIENCGAYGAAMASSYNRREPAAEVVLD